MIVGAVDGLIISVITQPCLLIPRISRRRNRGDVVLVLQETLSGIWRVENTACPLPPLVIGPAVLCMCVWIRGNGVCVTVCIQDVSGQKDKGQETV